MSMPVQVLSAKAVGSVAVRCCCAWRSQPDTSSHSQWPHSCSRWSAATSSGLAKLPAALILLGLASQQQQQEPFAGQALSNAAPAYCRERGVQPLCSEAAQ